MIMVLILVGVTVLVAIGINWCAFCSGWHDPDASCRPPKTHLR